MSELAEERSIGGGAKRAKIGVNALMHGAAGAFGLTVRYCLIYDSDGDLVSWLSSCPVARVGEVLVWTAPPAWVPGPVWVSED